MQAGGGARGQVHVYHQDCLEVPRSRLCRNPGHDLGQLQVLMPLSPASPPLQLRAQSLNSKFPGFAEAGLGFRSDDV